MFDDFMDELRKRQAEQQKKAAGEPGEQPDSGSAEGDESASAKTGNGKEEQPVTSDDSDREEPSGDDRDIFGGGGGGGGGGGPRRPRYVGPQGEMPEIHIGRGWVIVAAVVIGLVLLLTLFFSVGVGIWTDAIWYQSVGYADVFWTRIESQVGLFIIGLVFSFAFLWANLYLAGRLIPKGPLRRFSLDDFLDRFNVERYSGYGGGFGGPRNRRPMSRVGESVAVPDLSRPAFWGLLALGLLVALGFGGLFASNWTTVQVFNHRVPFGEVDPTFGRDIGFYVFELPFYRLFQSYANSLLFMAMLLTGLRYLVAVVSGASMPTSARVHFGVLVMLYLFSAAIGFQLDRFSLVYSQQSGIFQGVSYTDANAKFLALNVMTVLAAFAGTLFLLFCFSRWWVPLALTVSIWLVAYIGLGFIYPLAVQRLAVDPSQQAQETPYINDNIEMTRLGFNLQNWQTTQQPATGANLTSAILATEQPTVQNLRLWDYRPLGPTLSNIQQIRDYYNFGDVDTDRYTFTDPSFCAPNPAPCVRQVMLAGRELNPSKVAGLNQGNSSWVNQHLVYTHGIGLAMLPVNEVVRSGSSQSANPLLVIGDVPPTSQDGAPKVTEPRIYFATQASDYVIVGGTQEFDYPSATGDAYNSWTGTSGIRMDSMFTKLLFAVRFGDLNLVISNQVTGNSQLLFRRSIQERTAELAPFLRYDKDPYLVVTSTGRLVYILDAYTTSANFPDANTYNPGYDPSVSGLAGDPFNYIRNSVKVVMDAYDGTTTFYVADPKDPIIRAWQGIFPSLFKPLSAMPADLRGDPATNTPSHLRYPEDLFNAQTVIFEKYHVLDAGVFYQENNIWQVARNSGSGTNGLEELPLEAYYVEMQTPGGDGKPEFLLLQPMLLQNRPNMIAWVAVHNDPASYGQVNIYQFPADATIYGPIQMESVIVTNKEISQQLTLWSQQGSSVTMGNLLVVPTQNSILYVQPVYMQAVNNPIPVFQKVIVASGPNSIVWGDTLQDALNQLVSGGATPGGTPTPGPSGPTPGPTATPAPTGTPSAGFTTPPNATAQQLIALANQHYQAAQQALRNGDLATYQQEMNMVGQILAQLQKLLGTPAPTTP